ncbi:hypothetical protein CRG98_009502 [Punica granatum]|uniref:Zinc knuckle CX2CX4HX4C domain-containing protein n=1 Tax=Punica granatum TaxID=22663 RepID=A0A2I0KNM7_PUNGR|nr:hypothetical protein CRG98_009502 [Punica granatum]
MLSKLNITKLAERAGKVLEIDWKDTPYLPKWYVTLRALVQIPVAMPLCPRRRINWKNGTSTWVFFKYEYLKTFCYDYGILGHDQAHCTSETPEPLNLYGLWLHFDNQTDLLPPQITANPQMTTTNSFPTQYSESKPPSPTGNRGANPQKIGQQLSLNKFETSPDQSRGSHNMEAINAAGGRNTAQTRAILTVGDSKGKEIDTSELSFLRRSSDGVCVPGRKGKGKASRTFISTDTLYSGLIAEQIQAEAQFQTESSPYQSPATNPAYLRETPFPSSDNPD